MKTVAVLMSAYNGERYIREQIDSVLSQKDVDLTLFIRNDGSKDKTTEILEEYSKKPNVKVFSEENAGVGISFMRLVYKVPDSFDYYCFCDQDDIWLPDKIISGIDMISGKDIPMLYASNQELVDSEGVSYDMRYKDIPPFSYNQLVCANRLAGCTFVWNNKLQKELCDPKHRPEEDFFKIRIHDVWVMLTASLKGQIVYDPSSHIHYRIHANNVVGTTERKSFLRKIKSDFRDVFVKKKNGFRSRTCEVLISTFGDEMDEDKRKNTSDYASYRKSFATRLRLAFASHPYFWYDKETRSKYLFRILFGLW